MVGGLSVVLSVGGKFDESRRPHVQWEQGYVHNVHSDDEDTNMLMSMLTSLYIEP